MSNETMRTHVVIPRSVVETIDRLVGKRARSRFLAEAAEEKLRRVRLADSARKAAGSLVDKPTPSEWESSEGAAEWVRASRAADDDRLKHPLDRE